MRDGNKRCVEFKAYHFEGGLKGRRTVLRRDTVIGYHLATRSIWCSIGPGMNPVGNEEEEPEIGK